MACESGVGRRGLKLGTGGSVSVLAAGRWSECPRRAVWVALPSHTARLAASVLQHGAFVDDPMAAIRLHLESTIGDLLCPLLCSLAAQMMACRSHSGATRWITHADTRPIERDEDEDTSGPIRKAGTAKPKKHGGETSPQCDSDWTRTLFTCAALAPQPASGKAAKRVLGVQRGGQGKVIGKRCATATRHACMQACIRRRHT